MADQRPQYPARPPLNRGNTVPVYYRNNGPSSSAQDQPRVAADDLISHMTLSDMSKTLARHPDSIRRDQASFAQSNPASSIRPSLHHWHSSAHPPTPPLSTSPGSAASYPEEAYMQGFQSSNSRQLRPNPYPQTAAPPAMAQAMFTPLASDTSSNNFVRSFRAPPSQQHVKMRIDNTPAEYILSAPLGPGFDSSCITIAARKGNVLGIVADRWDSEKDCHYEWQVQFDRDADMSSIKASYTGGMLNVTVRRVVYRPPNPYAR